MFTPDVPLEIYERILSSPLRLALPFPPSRPPISSNILVSKPFAQLVLPFFHTITISHPSLVSCLLSFYLSVAPLSTSSLDSYVLSIYSVCRPISLPSSVKLNEFNRFSRPVETAS